MPKGYDKLEDEQNPEESLDDIIKSLPESAAVNAHAVVQILAREGYSTKQLDKESLENLIHAFVVDEYSIDIAKGTLKTTIDSLMERGSLRMQTLDEKLEGLTEQLLESEDPAQKFKESASDIIKTAVDGLKDISEEIAVRDELAKDSSLTEEQRKNHEEEAKQLRDLQKKYQGELGEALKKDGSVLPPELLDQALEQSRPAWEPHVSKLREMSSEQLKTKEGKAEALETVGKAFSDTGDWIENNIGKITLGFVSAGFVLGGVPGAIAGLAAAGCFYAGYKAAKQVAEMGSKFISWAKGKKHPYYETQISQEKFDAKKQDIEKEAFEPAQPSLDGASRSENLDRLLTSNARQGQLTGQVTPGLTSARPPEDKAKGSGLGPK